MAEAALVCRCVPHFNDPVSTVNSLYVREHAASGNGSDSGTVPRKLGTYFSLACDLRQVRETSENHRFSVHAVLHGFARMGGHRHSASQTLIGRVRWLREADPRAGR
jgi:hypothetical protein